MGGARNSFFTHIASLLGGDCVKNTNALDAELHFHTCMPWKELVVWRCLSGTHMHSGKNAARALIMVEMNLV